MEYVSTGTFYKELPSKFWTKCFGCNAPLHPLTNCRRVYDVAGGSRIVCMQCYERALPAG